MKKFYCYSKCSTCKKAQKWLDQNNVQYEMQDLVDDPPKVEELEKWISSSDKKLRYFFNTSGQHYRQLGLKDKVDNMSVSEAAKLLSSDGKLIKRPLMVENKVITCGFKEDIYEQVWTTR